MKWKVTAHYLESRFGTQSGYLGDEVGAIRFVANLLKVGKHSPIQIEQVPTPQPCSVLNDKGEWEDSVLAAEGDVIHPDDIHLDDKTKSR